MIDSHRLAVTVSRPFAPLLLCLFLGGASWDNPAILS